jgi:hypothetical protein
MIIAINVKVIDNEVEPKLRAVRDQTSPPSFSRTRPEPD